MLNLEAGVFAKFFQRNVLVLFLVEMLLDFDQKQSCLLVFLPHDDANVFRIDTCPSVVWFQNAVKWLCPVTNLVKKMLKKTDDFV